MSAAPEIHAVLLAAGFSTRMAPRNKLLLSFQGGAPMVAQAAASVCASRAHAVTIVLGHQAGAIRAAIQPHAKLSFVTAPGFAAGMSASLASGIAALPKSAAASLVCLADMPLVTTAMLDTLIDAYDPAGSGLIVIPRHQGARGNPVLWDRRFFADILALSGDSGARALLAQHAAWCRYIDMDTDAALRDFDTPEALGA